MPPSPPSNRKLSSLPQSRNSLVERCSSFRKCEPCKRRNRICNGQRPCSHCTDSNMDCIYSVVSEHPRSVFTTSSARRLSSGSACETCRRRKTKCDGGSPCGFCLANGHECVNNSERRRRSMGPPTVTAPNETEAMDRIEDRLRRIEKLMTAFTPSPLSQSSSTVQYSEEATAAANMQQPVRQHRHSVQGISVAKEQAELRAAYESMKGRSSSTSSPRRQTIQTDTLPTSLSARYVSPPNSTASGNTPPSGNTAFSPPPLTRLMISASQSSNLPKSSKTEPSSPPRSGISYLMQESKNSIDKEESLPPHQLHQHHHSLLTPTTPPPSNPSSVDLKTNFLPRPNSPLASNNAAYGYASNDMDWQATVNGMPSLMDQLSRRTFGQTMNYAPNNFPIYPLTPPPSLSRTHSPNSTSGGEMARTME
ncbi:hypothetical protein K450DRAFT_263037 [Umbelopsis ramanniana AG]|uniref:Zn(2)-C6 fungal-type domain-containing protein n=1 Tax=Umbelopsis ramanniana AG TaxID=1314678 RepID=A0AAD5HA53_UMBRA|nr:uncharacterized protein K450DRAFT_263037 [Umbelopsis ramanniana AG]KAI8575176.1 hypothetical protein K450DRAFT_263037 [Umbelopsis ramanniana AG]